MKTNQHIRGIYQRQVQTKINHKKYRRTSKISWINKKQYPRVHNMYVQKKYQPRIRTNTTHLYQVQTKIMTHNTKYETRKKSWINEWRKTKYHGVNNKYVQKKTSTTTRNANEYANFRHEDETFCLACLCVFLVALRWGETELGAPQIRYGWHPREWGGGGGSDRTETAVDESKKETPDRVPDKAPDRLRR